MSWSTDGLRRDQYRNPDPLEARIAFRTSKRYWRRTEIPWLNGAVARRGFRHGIPTPYNDFLVELISYLEDRACRKTSS